MRCASYATFPLVACDETTGSTAKASPEQIASFKDSCTAAGGMLHTTAGCNGTAVCKGSYLNLDNGKVSMNECAGKNTCRGIQCLAKDAQMSSASVSSSSVPMSSAAQQSALLAAPSLDAFRQECVRLGGKTSQEACNGHNSCKGTIFHTGAYGAKIGAVAVSCQGHNTCAGERCTI